jgi:hypothetical protein
VRALVIAAALLAGCASSEPKPPVQDPTWWKCDPRVPGTYSAVRCVDDEQRVACYFVGGVYGFACVKLADGFVVSAP